MTASSVRVAAIIPARMASSRFPGKPLLQMQDLPMVEHVRRRALRCKAFSEVVVATCDVEILRVVEAYGGRCVMTSAAHPGATDRVAEAAKQLDCTHVVNVQGDEILVLSNDLERMVHAIAAHPDVPAWNAVSHIEHREEFSDRSVVKCLLSTSGRVLCCLRDATWLGARLMPPYEPMRKMLGIIAYNRACLERYLTLPRTPLELAEAIDQSRLLEHDLLLQTVEFSRGYPGINAPAEVAVVRRYLEEDPVQQVALQEILRA